ncbi:hypothetical protein DOT_0873 [Desulfosporosinus sp. OT]|nr:hypothetical protein DOT_0873 [Desulfosporosinus sp. OT]
MIFIEIMQIAGFESSSERDDPRLSGQNACFVCLGIMQVSDSG